MKNENDLFEEWLVYLLDQAGKHHEAVRAHIDQMRRRLTFRQAQPLTDQAYEEKLLVLKQEAPAYLRHLGLE